jgi:site-specific DNA-cytosine methylase
VLCRSAADAVVTDTLEKAFEAEGIDVAFEHKFLYECKDSKRNWCVRVHNAIDDACSPCAFDDITTLITDTRFCTVHRRACLLPDRLDVLFSGFSCKDFARPNNNRANLHGKAIFASASSPGKSADTMHATLDLLRHVPTEMFILENVDEMADALHKPALEELQAALGGMNYDVTLVIMNPADYSLPQNRKRLWIVGVARPSRLLEKGTSYKTMFATMNDLLKRCALPCGSLEEILLPATDPMLTNELENRPASPKGWDSSTIDAHRKAWQDLGLRWQATKPALEDMQSPWFHCLPCREKDLLAYHQQITLPSSAANPDVRAHLAAKRVGCDLNQSIQQRANTTMHSSAQVVCPSIMPSMKLWISTPPHWSNQRHGLMLGYEAMLAQGWPVNDPRFREIVNDHSNAFLQDLGGNMFPTTCCAAVLISMVLSLRFADSIEAEAEDHADHTTGDDVAEAILMMRRSRLGRSQCP